MRALILDFDGTIAMADVGDELCDRFAGPEWLELDLMWERRELSLDDAQTRMWALVRGTAAQLDAYTDEISRLREGFGTLLDTAQAEGMTLVLASGGFDHYIHRILGPVADRFDALFYNTMTYSNDGVQVAFPHLESLGCGLCAVCKGRVCDRYRAAGYEVTFAGDGNSDWCVLDRADHLFAVRNSKLAGRCDEAGAAYTPFESFETITAAIRGGGDHS